MDNLTKEQRKHCMSQITSDDTKIEVQLRKYTWHKGLKGYRVKNKLPGKPDFYFPKHKVSVFVDGCFWHKCPKCFVRPKSNNKYWDEKIERNVERDKEVNQKLKEKGWEVVRVWGHEVKENIEKSFKKIQKAVNKNNSS